MMLPRPATVALLLAGAALLPPATARTSRPDPPASQPAATSRPAPPEVDPRWLERMSKLDRALLDDLVGFAPPAFAADLVWVAPPGKESTTPTWSDLRGRVVVLQSWTSRTGAGRKVPILLERTLESFDAKDVAVLLLHTPDGADAVQTFLERRPNAYPVAIDASGAFCDDLGVYKRPVNVVVDRQGTVRYAGLSWPGLKPALEKLVAEEFAPGRQPTPRPEPDPSATAFPPTGGSITDATDLRGRTAPPLVVDRWLGPAPSPRHVVVVGFWRSDSTVCVASLLHLGELAAQAGSEVLFVAVSDEERRDMDDAFQRLEDEMNFDPARFPCALAIDPRGRMMHEVGVQRLPHAIVMSRDWIVRWQGHPAALKASLLETIVRADRAQAGEDRPQRPRRWAAGR